MFDDDPSLPCWRCGAARGCEHREGVDRPALEQPEPSDNRKLGKAGNGWNLHRGWRMRQDRLKR